MQHRHHGEAEPSGEYAAADDAKNDAGTVERILLGNYLYRADKMSRLCFCCEARESCKWSEEEKNMEIIL